MNIMNNLIKDDQSCSIRTDDGWRYTEYMFMKVITDHSEKEQLFEFWSCSVEGRCKCLAVFIKITMKFAE